MTKKATPRHPTFRGLYLDAFNLAVTLDTKQANDILIEGVRRHKTRMSTLDNPYVEGRLDYDWINKDTEAEHLRALSFHTPADTREMLMRFLAVAMTEDAHDANKKPVAEAHYLAGELLTHPWPELGVPFYGIRRGYFHLQQSARKGINVPSDKIINLVRQVGTQGYGGIVGDFQAACDRYAGLWGRLTIKVLEERFNRANIAAQQPK